MIYEAKHRAEFVDLVSRSYYTPINEFHFNGALAELMFFFDKEGFELTELEELYRKCNGGLTLTRKAFGHRAIGWHWIENCDVWHPDIFVDHSYIVYRPNFTGEAKKQIERYVQRYPYLNKLLAIKPKVGLDLALEYITPELTTEVLHLEMDFHNEAKAWETLIDIQGYIKHWNWIDVVEKIKVLQPVIDNLPSDDQSDIKARLMGFDRTYQTLKTV